MSRIGRVASCPSVWGADTGSTVITPFVVGCSSGSRGCFADAGSSGWRALLEGFPLVRELACRKEDAS